jgi:hypothetical protein
LQPLAKSTNGLGGRFPTIRSAGSYTEVILVQQTTSECLNQQGLDVSEMRHMRHEKVLKPIEFTEKAR